MKTILRFTVLLALLAGVCFAQGTGGGMIIQTQSGGTTNGTFKKYFVLNCVSGLTCSVSGSKLSMTGTGGGSAFPLTITGGVSGAVPCFTATTTESAGTLLAANGLVLGGGAGVCPSTLASLGTTTTLLHGNAAGAPTFGAVSLTADVSGVLPAANGGTVPINTSAQGWVLLPGLSNGANTVTYSGFGAANAVWAMQFVAPTTGTYTKLSFRLSTAVAATTTDFGIYSADGTTKVTSMGGVSTAAGTVISATVSAFTLNAGQVYWYATCSTGTTVVVHSWSSTGFDTDLLNQESTKRSAIAGNTCTAGVLPSSLGTLTSASTQNYPKLMLLP